MLYKDQADQHSLCEIQSVAVDCECNKISDVKVVSLPLYLVLLIFRVIYQGSQLASVFGVAYFLSYIGTRQINISLLIPVSDHGL